MTYMKLASQLSRNERCSSSRAFNALRCGALEGRGHKSCNQWLLSAWTTGVVDGDTREGPCARDIRRMVDAFVEYEQIRLPYVFDPNEHSNMLLMRTQSSHQPNCKTTWVGMLMATTHNIKHPVSTLPSPS